MKLKQGWAIFSMFRFLMARAQIVIAAAVLPSDMQSRTVFGAVAAVPNANIAPCMKPSALVQSRHVPR